jgi:outer membrane murein-binding lipoprotein Lpp
LARFLALDWDHKQLHVIAATVTGNKVRIDQALVLAEPRSPNPAEAEVLGKLLRERLQAAHIAPAPVLACIGRDRVILKDLRYPPVPDAQEPEVVRFQALKESSEPANEVVIDYLPVGTDPSSGQRRALALLMRRELLATYQNLCRAAGLKLQALTPRPFGLAGCVQRLAAAGTLAPAPAADATIAVVAASEGWAEFIVLRGGLPVYARSLAVGPGLQGDLRRNLAVYAGQGSQFPISAVYLAGTADVADFHQRLQGALPVPVHLFDPFAPVDRPNLPVSGRGGFAGALGLLYSQAARQGQAINFLKVRQGQPAGAANRRRLVALAAVLGVLVLLGVAGWYWRLTQLDKELHELEAKQADLKQQADKMNDDEKRFQAVNDWNESEVVWLDELYNLTANLGNPYELQLTQINGTPLAKTAKSKQIAKLAIKGLATDKQQPLQDFKTALVQDSHYRVEPLVPSRNTVAGNRFQFPQQFTTAIELIRQPPGKYAQRLPDKPLERPNRGADAFGGFFGVGP